MPAAKPSKPDNQARRVVEAFGGTRACAAALRHRWPSTVHSWVSKGVIPEWRRDEVVKAAKRNKVVLPADYLNAK